MAALQCDKKVFSSHDRGFPDFNILQTLKKVEIRKMYFKRKDCRFIKKICTVYHRPYTAVNSLKTACAFPLLFGTCHSSHLS